MDEESLQASLAAYKAQLSQVDGALSAAGMESNEDLVKLRSDLEELITLTEDSLLSLKKSQLFSMLENTSDASSSSSASVPASHRTPIPAQHSGEAPDLDAEFAAFQAAIAEDKQPKDDESSQDLPGYNSEEEPTTGPEAPSGGGDLPDLSDIIGTKCRAPFSQEWGGLHYQNALIFSVEPLTADSTPQVRVLFCHPTTPAMKPCSFFLEGKCRFTEETCRFSHGHEVSVEDLQEYVEPDLSDIKLESRVRARYDDGLWYPAVVVEINENEESLKVMFDNYNEAETVDYEDIILLDADAESDSEHEERTEAVSRSESEDEDDQLPVYLWRPNQTTDKLGQWETHTKGIGSRLMAKMGYIMGQGLGKESKGRAEPVPIQLLPQGKSLDKIMELKELAGDQDLYDVMKKADNRKKKQEQKQEFSYKKETPKSVFDFINKKLHGKKGDLHSLVKKPSHNKTHSVTHISEGDLKKKSDRSINIQLLKTHEELQGVNKEMGRLKQSLQRNQGNNSVKKKLEQQLASLEQYKTQLQSSELSMQKHQQSRKNQRKLTIF